MKKLSALLILISLSVFFIFSCQKDKTYEAGESNNLRTTVTGIVLDESNAPLTGVTVTAYGQTTTTNQYGTFVLKNITANKDRCVLQFTKAGFFNRAHGFIASANTVNYVRIVLLSNAATQNFSAAVGGIISLPDGSSVEFEPNAIVTSTGSAYTGTVNLIVKHLSPDDANFGFTIPGGDLAAINANNEDVVLYTYGMLGVELTGSSGEALQLAAGTSATLTMAIAPSQLSSAPATIPLWYFDETTSLWKEEGAANKVGNNYVGTVNHFSWWNCDFPGTRAYIKGKVIDCDGNPVPNIHVSTSSGGHGLTDQNGAFRGGVPAGTDITVQVIVDIYNQVLQAGSQIENVSALLENQEFVLPDLIVPCPARIQGCLKKCQGENIDGIISLTEISGIPSMYYTIDGSFNIPCLANASITLNAYSYSDTTNFSFSSPYQSLQYGNILNIGNILLCDTITAVPNNFTINGGPFANRFFPIITIPNFPPYGGCVSGFFYVLAFGSSPPNYQIEHAHVLFTHDTIPGTYSFDSTHVINIRFNNTVDTFLIHTENNGIINMIQIDNVGGRIKGNYSGDAAMSINGGLYNPITLSGNFDVLRTQ